MQSSALHERTKLTDDITAFRSIIVMLRTIAPTLVGVTPTVNALLCLRTTFDLDFTRDALTGIYRSHALGNIATRATVRIHAAFETVHPASDSV